MSAFVVSKDDISILIAAGVKLCSDHVPGLKDKADGIGQTLLNECVRSVSYRYPDDDLGELPGSIVTETICDGIAPVQFAEHLTPYTYTEPDELTRELVAETVSSYEYQSCEHPEWGESWSYKYCQMIRTLIDELPTAAVPEPPTVDPEQFARAYGDLSRNETIKRIRAALKRRSGKVWSVTGGTGTAWGWITIQAPPKRRTGAHVQREGAEVGVYEHVDTGEAQQFGIMTPQDCAELAELLGKDRVHHQGESVSSGSDYYREYIDRAEGREITAYGKQYWD